MDSDYLRKLKPKDLPETLEYILENFAIPDTKLAQILNMSLLELGEITYEGLDVSEDKFKKIRKKLVTLMLNLEKIEQNKYRG